MYVEKACLTDQDPFIWNNEGVSVNQIKTKEYLICDESESAWICGYLAQDYDGGALTITYTDPPRNYTTDLAIQSYIAGKKSSRLAQQSLSFKFANRAKHPSISGAAYYKIYNAVYNTSYGQWLISYDSAVQNTYDGFIWGNSTGYSDEQTVLNNQTSILNNMMTDGKIVQALWNYRPAAMPTPNESIFNEILQDNGKTVYSTNDEKLYTLSTYYPGATTYNQEIYGDITKIDGIDAIKTYIYNKLTTLTDKYLGISSSKLTFNYSIVLSNVELKASVASFLTDTFVIPGKNQRAHLKDSPYDMFCIPYKLGGLKVKLSTSENNVITTMNSSSALAFSQALARELGQNLIDMQVLPFCPLQGWVMDDDIFTLIDATKNKNYAIDEDGNNYLMFFSTSSSGTLNSGQLKYFDSEDNSEVTIDTLKSLQTNKKIANECDMWRLCSPNYSGQFQFNCSKLDGLTGFNVDYTYLPHSPYIHINPNFSGLYGKDFDDARGLICKGDFSVSYTSDKWVEYQINNRNYMNAFNRQISNMEISQDIERKQQKWSIATGSVTGATSGAATGLIASGGNPYAAIAGAAVGGVASVAGGLADYKYSEVLRNEAIDYTKDQFNYSLDNIKGMPESVANLTTITKNNKIMPIIEYYTCTNEERRAIANKIAYNGMTVMRIGNLQEFITNSWSFDDIVYKGYVKGQLIRFESDGEDFHLSNEIAGELAKGVYIQ